MRLTYVMVRIIIKINNLHYHIISYVKCIKYQKTHSKIIVQFIARHSQSKYNGASAPTVFQNSGATFLLSPL